MLCDLRMEVNHFRKGLQGWLSHTMLFCDYGVFNCDYFKLAFTTS